MDYVTLGALEILRIDARGVSVAKRAVIFRIRLIKFDSEFDSQAISRRGLLLQRFSRRGARLPLATSWRNVRRPGRRRRRRRSPRIARSSR